MCNVTITERSDSCGFTHRTTMQHVTSAQETGENEILEITLYTARREEIGLAQVGNRLDQSGGEK